MTDQYFIEVIQKPFEGWSIYLLKGADLKSAKVFKSMGPKRIKPSNAVLKLLKETYCEGQEAQVLWT